MFDAENVSLYATYFSRDADGNRFRVDYPFHDCTDEDWDEFYPPDEDTINFLNNRAYDYNQTDV